MKQVTAKDVLKIVSEKHYALNDDIMRRIEWYSYKDATTLIEEDGRIVIRTEMPIKGVYDTMILYPNGKSEVTIQFD